MEIPEKKVTVIGAISVGITWVDGAIAFKPETKAAQALFGICHFGEAIWAISPADYKKVTMITTIQVSNMVNYCDKSKVCLHFKCKFNNFDKQSYFDMFKDARGFSLGTPHDFGTKPLWFNEGEYLKKWKYFILKITGGALLHKKRLEK